MQKLSYFFITVCAINILSNTLECRYYFEDLDANLFLEMAIMLHAWYGISLMHQKFGVRLLYWPWYRSLTFGVIVVIMIIGFDCNNGHSYGNHVVHLPLESLW